MHIIHDTENNQYVLKYPGNVIVRIDYLTVAKNFEKSTGELFTFTHEFRDYILSLAQGILNYAMDKSK